MKFNLLIKKTFFYCSFLLLSLFILSDAIAAPDVWDVLRREFKLHHEVNRPEVQEQIRWLAAHPTYLQKVCRQSEPYIYHIVGEIKKRKLPGELALIPIVESAYDPFAYSGAGAAGLWQLMPQTGTELGLKQDWWFDGRRSIRPSTDAALNYLVYLNKFFRGNWVLAVAAYDSGEGTMARAIKSTTRPGRSVNFWNLPVPRETKAYIPRFMALAEIIKNPKRYKVDLPEIPYLPYFQEVNIGSQIDLNHAAKMAGISYKELIKLNPGFNRWTTTPYKPHKLLIPTEKVKRFSHNLANMPEDKRVSWTKYLVKKGDTLSTVAIRHHTTTQLIKQLNQLSSNKLKLNQTILIPSSKNTAVIAHKQNTDAKPPLKKIQISVRNRRVIHIVQDKDTLKTIKNKYGVSTKNIRGWNNIASNAPLKKGQQLVIWKTIKQPVSYTVKPGDSLSLIAHRHNTKINQILDLNPGVKRHKALKVGQRLLVG